MRAGSWKKGVADDDALEGEDIDWEEESKAKGVPRRRLPRRAPVQQQWEVEK